LEAAVAEGSISRTLRVLKTLCAEGPATLAELSESTGLSMPTLLRMLRIMDEEGYVTRGEGRAWRPSMLIWQLGCAAVDGQGAANATQRVIDELAVELNETVVFALHENGRMTYIAQALPTRSLRSNVPMGGHFLATDTSTGHAVLAWLPKGELDAVLALKEPPLPKTGAKRNEYFKMLYEIGRRGFEHGSGTIWQGMWGAAAPVFGRYGKVIGAVGVVIPSSREPKDVNAVGRQMRAAAAQLTAIYGGPLEVPEPTLLDN
jgi:DNA-binding IclR family transcriptional regulator